MKRFKGYGFNNNTDVVKEDTSFRNTPIYKKVYKYIHDTLGYAIYNVVDNDISSYDISRKFKEYDINWDLDDGDDHIYDIATQMYTKLADKLFTFYKNK